MEFSLCRVTDVNLCPKIYTMQKLVIKLSDINNTSYEHTEAATYVYDTEFITVRYKLCLVLNEIQNHCLCRLHASVNYHYLIFCFVKRKTHWGSIEYHHNFEGWYMFDSESPTNALECIQCKFLGTKFCKLISVFLKYN